MTTTSILCSECGAEYDVTLFAFDRAIRCDCGARVELATGHTIGSTDHAGPQPASSAVGSEAQSEIAAYHGSRSESAFLGQDETMSILDRFRLDGKRAFITGGSRGLGREITLALADAGAEVILVGRSRESLEATAEDIRRLGRHAVALLDISKSRHGGRSGAAPGALHGSSFDPAQPFLVQGPFAPSRYGNSNTCPGRTRQTRRRAGSVRLRA